MSPVAATPLRGLNGNSDEEQRRTPTGKILLASPGTTRLHAQHLRELEKLNEQNSKLRRDIQKVQQSSRLLMSRRRDLSSAKKSLVSSEPKSAKLSPVEREKMATTIEIWQRRHNSSPPSSKKSIDKASPFGQTLPADQSSKADSPHDETRSLSDSIDGIDDRALDQASMQPEDSTSNVYTKHVEAYAREISVLRDRISTYDKKLDEVTKSCEHRIQIAEQALREAQTSSHCAIQPKQPRSSSLGFSTISIALFLGASALFTADFCRQFPTDLHRAAH